MNSLRKSIISSEPLPREEYKQLLFAALQVESFSFARRLGLLWLEKYPGDLEITYTYARILANDGELDEARSILESISDVDPEFIEVQELLAKFSAEEDGNPSVDALACVYGMGRTIYADFKIPEWSFIFRTAWQAYLAGQYEDAEQIIRQVIVQKPQLALAAILHHRIVLARQDVVASVQLVKIYHERFPKCLYFTLQLADDLMNQSNAVEAIELLQACAAADAYGLVSTRLWGSENRYRNLWPERFEVDLNLAIPAEVVSFLGLNNLPEGELQATQPEPAFDAPESLAAFEDTPSDEFVEEPHSVRPRKHAYRGESPSQAAHTTYTSSSSTDGSTIQVVDEIFERLAKKLKQPDLTRSDGRFPVYVILSLKNKLIEKYGKQTFLVLDAELENLATTVRGQLGWGSVIIYPDDANSMVSYGLTAIDQVDPWKIKNVLTDLDQAMGKKGEMIGALLIVGSSDIVPYHRLPNPTEDLDADVASDNPYAALDGNYFVQEWPVGRFPDEPGSDAGFLLSQIRLAISRHTEGGEPISFLQRILALLRLFQVNPESRQTTASLGYSAAVWQRASRAVFKVIGPGQSVMTSPPEQTGSISSRRLSTSRLSYFNLHGLEDGAEWYGQKELGDQDTQVDYPVALTPGEIARNSDAPQIIFSEACYGGHVNGKSENSSIAMKYIGIGSSVFIGSTCVAYGSIDTPLIGADLLAQLFWRNMSSSSSVGEAFSRAKLEFVKEMDRRQGFLDGEDQKTLLSFIYFGDPLSPVSSQGAKSKRLIRRITVPKINILSEDEDMSSFEADLPAESIQEVKKIAEIYLPGLEEMNIRVTQQQMYESLHTEESRYDARQYRRKTVQGTENGQTVITVSKTVPIDRRVHHHYLRARINKAGQLEKVAISR